MNTKYIFPCALMALDVAAAVVYLCGGDWKRCIYWLAAATKELRGLYSASSPAGIRFSAATLSD